MPAGPHRKTKRSSVVIKERLGSGGHVLPFGDSVSPIREKACALGEEPAAGCPPSLGGGGDGEPCPRSVAPPIDVGFCLERRRSLRWRPMLSSRPDSGRVSAPLLYVGRVFPAMTGRALRAERAPDEQKRATDCSLVTFVAGRGYLLRRACRIDGLRKARLPSFALP